LYYFLYFENLTTQCVMDNKSLLDQSYNRDKYSLANQSVWELLSTIKGEEFRLYRERLKKAESGELLSDFPIEVLIKTTLNCNHLCPRCPHGMGITPRGDAYNMKFETLKKIIDEGSEKGLGSVVFTGGEPTLHPEFLKFIRYTAEKNIPDIAVITNGSLLTDEIIDGMIESNVTRVNISFDSTSEEVYKKVRGVDDYNKVLSNIRRLISRRKELGSLLPLLSISFVLSEDNAGELDGFIDMWGDIADGGIKIYPYKNIYSIMDIDLYSRYGLGENTPLDIKDELRPKRLSRDYSIMEDYVIKCTIPWYRSHVGINGELQGCTTLGFCDHKEMMMGNIYEMTYEEAWKSAKWANLRAVTLSGNYSLNPVCSLCQKSV